MTPGAAPASGRPAVRARFDVSTEIEPLAGTFRLPRRCGKYPMRSVSGSAAATVSPCCSRLLRIGPIPFPRRQRAAVARARGPGVRAGVSFRKQIIRPDVS
ncbi:protein of unknown function [Burkholderia multivorans]